MQLLVEQLHQRALELERWLEAELGPPAEVRVVRDLDADDRDAPFLLPGGDWREPLNTTVWLRFTLRRPDDWPAEHTALVAQRLGTLLPETGAAARVGVDLQRIQGLLYLDGKAYHGLDQYHRFIPVPEGPEYRFAASLWTGFAQMEWQPNPVFRLVRADPGATQLRHDLRILDNALRTLPADDPARVELERTAEAALLAIDWSCPGSDAFRASLSRAHEIVRDRLDASHGAAYEPKIAAVGHAHIDCAWLWPIAQTREKAARTWSTVLRL